MLAAMAGSSRRSAPIVAVVPVGSTDAAVIQELIPVLRETFHAEVLVAPAVALPERAWNGSRGQYLSTAILDQLAGARRPEWERLIGVSDVDLYVPDLNFVFGEGDARRRVAVFSLARLRPAGTYASARRQLVHRAATEAIHELGHTYGLGHCTNPRCVMWFSNTLAETDRKGTAFCPIHAAELARNRLKDR